MTVRKNKLQLLW